MSSSRVDKENDKFLETSGGDTSIRTGLYGYNTASSAWVEVQVDTDGKLVITLG